MAKDDSSDNLNDAHNRGQEDAANGEYNPPIGVWVPFDVTDEQIAESEAYDKGYNNHWDQTHPGCFLTTACVEVANLPDDCRELTALRRFRDDVLNRTAEGQRLIRHYYAIAPVLLRVLGRREDRTTILTELFSDVQATVRCVEARDYTQAIRLYAEMVRSLAERVGVSVKAERFAI